VIVIVALVRVCVDVGFVSFVSLSILSLFMSASVSMYFGYV
jgi:hypothetical protein